MVRTPVLEELGCHLWKFSVTSSPCLKCKLVHILIDPSTLLVEEEKGSSSKDAALVALLAAPLHCSSIEALRVVWPEPTISMLRAPVSDHMGVIASSLQIPGGIWMVLVSYTHVTGPQCMWRFLPLPGVKLSVGSFPRTFLEKCLLFFFFLLPIPLLSVLNQGCISSQKLFLVHGCGLYGAGLSTPALSLHYRVLGKPTCPFLSGSVDWIEWLFHLLFPPMPYIVAAELLVYYSLLFEVGREKAALMPSL